MPLEAVLKCTDTADQSRSAVKSKMDYLTARDNPSESVTLVTPSQVALGR